MSISIVFPAFDEERKISADILRASEFLNSNKIDGEIIVVDDGSNDNTYEIAKECKSKIDSDLKILSHNSNLGKGFAVKTGILAASKELILYSDVGGVVPIDQAINGIDKLNDKKADIAHGSRKLPDSKIIKKQDKDRRFASWLFNTFFKPFLGIPKDLTDTQCGFKLYKTEVAKILFTNLKTAGFLFEIEIILRAFNENYKIIEFPIEWKCDRDSRIKLVSTTPKVIREIFQIRKMFN